jgi:hypothetical protein
MSPEASEEKYRPRRLARGESSGVRREALGGQSRGSRWRRSLRWLRGPEEHDSSLRLVQSSSSSGRRRRQVRRTLPYLRRAGWSKQQRAVEASSDEPAIVRAERRMCREGQKRESCDQQRGRPEASTSARRELRSASSSRRSWLEIRRRWPDKSRPGPVHAAHKLLASNFERSPWMSDVPDV